METYLASYEKIVNYTVLLGQITLGLNWKNILLNHRRLLTRMTQIYMSYVYSALR